MTTLDLAPQLSPLEEITNHVATIQRPDDPIKEYNERRDYLSSEVDNGAISPKVAMQALINTPNAHQDVLIQQTYEELLVKHNVDESTISEKAIEEAKLLCVGKYMQDIFGQFELRLVPDADANVAALQIDPPNPTVIENSPMTQTTREPKPSLKERISNYRPVKALKAAKAAYAAKARAQRELNSIDPDSPTYDAATHEAAKTFAAEKAVEYRLARKRAIGGTALAGSVVGVVVAMSDKLSLPFGSSESWQEGKNMLALGATGALLGALSLHREKRKISEDQRKGLLEWKNAEIDNYEQLQADDHDFDNDAHYQELLDQANDLAPADRLRGRLSTKWAEWGAYGGAHATTAGMVSLSWIQKTIQKIQGDGFTTTEKVLNWSLVDDQDVITGRENLQNRLRTLFRDTPEDEWNTSTDIQNAQAELRQYEIDAIDELGTEQRKLNRRGYAAIGVGLIASASALYLSKYGFDFNPFNNGHPKGSSDIANNVTPGSGNKTGATGTATTLPRGNSSGSVTEHLTPKRQGIYDQLDNGSQGRLNEFMPTTPNQKGNTTNTILDAADQISQTHKVDIGSDKFNKIAENTFKLAAEREKFIGNGGSGRQFDANFQAYIEHMKDLEKAAQ